MTLHGPAHPDQFRVKVGRYKERYYFDPLPACPIAPACDESWPSVTKIAKAASQDWSFVSVRRVADWFHDNGRKMMEENPDRDELRRRFSGADRAGLNKAFERGNDIHAFMESQATGQTVMVGAEAEPYLDACKAFLDDCQPEWVLSEVVIINRTVGYGGSADTIRVVIETPDLGRRLVDWKTRTSADVHNVYPAERRQVAAYANGEYMIVDDGGQAKRMAIPELDGGLIVSIAPEGYKLYPFDLEPAWQSFLKLHEFYLTTLDEPTYKPIHVPRHHAEPVDPELVERLRAEVLWIKETSPAGLAAIAQDWPDGVPTFTQGGPTDADQTALLAMLVERVKRDHNVPFNPADNPEPAPVVERETPAVEVKAAPDEGQPIGMLEYEDAQKCVAGLNDRDQDWIGQIAQQAHAAGASISLKQRQTERRYHIVKGLAAMAPHGEDELLRALVALAVDDDSLTSPAMPAGAVVASLGAAEAVAFARLCEQYATGRLTTAVGEDNRLRVLAAAGV